MSKWIWHLAEKSPADLKRLISSSDKNPVKDKVIESYEGEWVTKTLKYMKINFTVRRMELYEGVVVLTVTNIVERWVRKWKRDTN